MKVLWYCNVLLPKAAEAAKIKGEINTAGWIEGFLNQIWSDYKWGGAPSFVYFGKKYYLTVSLFFFR